MKHKDIQFKSRRTKAMETTDNKEQDNGEFQELLHEGVLANYMDDFVIPAKTMEELEE